MPSFLAQPLSIPAYLQTGQKNGINCMSHSKEEIAEQIQRMLMEKSAENEALRKLLASMHLPDIEDNQLQTGKE